MKDHRDIEPFTKTPIANGNSECGKAPVDKNLTTPPEREKRIGKETKWVVVL